VPDELAQQVHLPSSRRRGVTRLLTIRVSYIDESHELTPKAHARWRSWRSTTVDEGCSLPQRGSERGLQQQ
jgi:hypothetical protein